MDPSLVGSSLHNEAKALYILCIWRRHKGGALEKNACRSLDRACHRGAHARLCSSFVDSTATAAHKALQQCTDRSTTIFSPCDALAYVRSVSFAQCKLFRSHCLASHILASSCTLFFFFFWGINHALQSWLATSSSGLPNSFVLSARARLGVAIRYVRRFDLCDLICAWHERTVFLEPMHTSTQ